MTVIDDELLTTSDEACSISEAAERSGLSAHTLRYYERTGLLTVTRDPVGHRVYTAADLRRIAFITRLRQTDMPIREIQRYYALADAGASTEAERLDLLVRHRASVGERLATLQAALDAIDFKITCYGGSGRP